MNISKFIQELKRRNVFKVAVAYAIAGWLIIQIVATVFPAFEFPGWTTQFVIILVGIGFPLALIFAWAFELTPEGLKKSKEVDITESVTDRTGKKLNGIIISVLSVAVFFLIVERVFFAKSSILEDAQTSATVETASIAVLPFVNMSSDSENEYFSDGLSEELLNALAKVEDMRVAGRTSSFKFKGQNENLSEIGAELGVAHILEGSVRKDGNRVRITAQLIKVDDGYHLWSETYDRELDNIFAIQEEISRRVLDQLKVFLLPEDEAELESIPTSDIEAYDAYLKANQLIINRDIDEINVAIELYNTAIKLDPSFAQAHAKLAHTYQLQNYYGNVPEEKAVESVLRHAQIAMDLNNQIGESHLAMGVYHDITRDFEKAQEFYLRSLELNPNLTDVYNLLGNIYIDELDEEEKWKEMVKQMYEVDPLNPLAIYNKGRVGLNEEDLEMAEEYFLMNMKKNPEFIPSYIGLAFMKSNAPVSKFDESFIAVHKAYSLDNNFTRSLSIMIYRLITLGMQEPATHYMDIMQRNFPESDDYLGLVDDFGEEFGDYSYYNKDKRDFSHLDPKNIPDFHISDQIDYAINTDDLDKAFQLFRFHYPELFDYSQELEEDNWRRIDLIELYNIAGKADSARMQTQKYCEFVETIPDLEEEGIDSDRYFFSRNWCLFLNNDFKSAQPFVEEMFTERRVIGFVNFVLRSDRPLDVNLRNSPEIRPLLLNVKKELDEQAENVRQYLIEQGEWKEEWEEN
ncbi:MAG: tetratricopeptide repeat protein [Balneola sp.]|nr:tetratricopeptide repeat protein [Balneola sp.]MBO6651232.1 tetratricopeptide repeat protein [Balneola sp.]MBO6712027.1 tetratricopeptide repeat protein [Balneola sp.]MBO6800221.1 tetratricopeptide repeat protein [Balneola sp.]MBO6869765.1 tetratricopeptide repeat protein [Balneola sp.]